MALRLRGSGDKPWDEYGTTTGRPRRVGWLDLVMLRHAARINGLTELVITKLDILSGLDEIQVCNAYRLDGATIDYYPSDIPSLSRCLPVYDTLPGWPEDIMATRNLKDLPQNAQTYIQFIAAKTGVPVTAVSVGPGRDQVIHL
jgi:adenylosuccinate synthase